MLSYIKIVILLLVIIVISITFYGFYKSNINTNDIDLKDKEVDIEELTEKENKKEGEEQSKYIMVHISGQVFNPGIVELKNGSRLIDAVNSVGGLKEEADLDRINLAKKLVDEEKIYIPKIGEENEPSEQSGTSNERVQEDFQNGNNKLNINTATKEELMSLPGIGDVFATRIIEYREGNKFKVIEDIKNVSGIGDKRFEDIEDLITVN